MPLEVDLQPSYESMIFSTVRMLLAILIINSLNYRKLYSEPALFLARVEEDQTRIFSLALSNER